MLLGCIHISDLGRILNYSSTAEQMKVTKFSRLVYQANGYANLYHLIWHHEKMKELYMFSDRFAKLFPMRMAEGRVLHVQNMKNKVWTGL